MRSFSFLLLAMSEVSGTVAAQPRPQSPSQSQAPSQAVRDSVLAAIRDGHAKLARRRAVDALADFDRAIALAPDWGAAHASRGLALFELRRYAEAEVEMATALRLGEADPFVQRSVGHLRLMVGQFGQAVRAYTRSLELEPDNEEALD